MLRALELNPNLAEAYHFYSFYLMVRGRYEEAVDAAKRAHELDPLSLRGKCSYCRLSQRSAPLRRGN